MNETQRDELRNDLADLLAECEQELRALGRWEGVAPSADRLASQIPFCHDTLDFPQWVQWIFIPRFRELLEGGHALPTQCAIAPIAELALANIEADTDELLALLRAIDRLVTAQGRSVVRK